MRCFLVAASVVLSCCTCRAPVAASCIAPISDPAARPQEHPAPASGAAPRDDIADRDGAAPRAADSKPGEFARYKPAIEKIRGATFTKDVPVKHVPSIEVKAVLRRLMERRLPGDTLAHWVMLLHGLRHLGFAPASLSRDLRKARDLWGEDSPSVYTAVYDPASRTCLISADTMKIEQEAVVVHELTHALQHQEGRLEGLDRSIVDDLDAATAQVGLIEGEAQVVAYLWSVSRASGGSVPGRMPPILLASMLAETRSREELVLRRGGDASGWFGYGRGALFVAKLLEDGGWDAVQDAFGDLPRSTEQVLHPVKYADERDVPQRLRLPERLDALPAGSRTLLETTLGEYQIFLWLLQELPRVDAVHASTGWDGDRVRLIRTGEAEDALAVVIASAWDSERDANQFVKALKRRAEGSSIGIRRDGRDVAVAIAPQGAGVEALLAELLRFDRLPVSGGERAETSGETSGWSPEDEATTREEERRIMRALEREQDQRGWEVVGDEVQSHMHRFRMRLPGPNWMVALQAPNRMVHVSIVRHSTGDNVNVVVTPEEKDTGAVAIAERARDHYVKSMTDDPGEVRAMDFHGHDAAELRYTVAMMDRSAHYRQVFVQANGRCYVVTCTRMSDDPGVEEAFDRVLESFRLDD